jgi:hypothetical protein
MYVTLCVGLSVCVKNSANALCMYIFLNLYCVGLWDIRSPSATKLVATF